MLLAGGYTASIVVEGNCLKSKNRPNRCPCVQVNLRVQLCWPSGHAAQPNYLGGRPSIHELATGDHGKINGYVAPKALDFAELSSLPLQRVCQPVGRSLHLATLSGIVPLPFLVQVLPFS